MIALAHPYRQFVHRPAIPKGCWSDRIEESPQVSELIVQDVTASGCVTVCDLASCPRPTEKQIRELPLRHPFGNEIDPRCLPESPRKVIG